MALKTMPHVHAGKALVKVDGAVAGLRAAAAGYQAEEVRQENRIEYLLIELDIAHQRKSGAVRAMQDATDTADKLQAILG